MQFRTEPGTEVPGYYQVIPAGIEFHLENASVPILTVINRRYKMVAATQWPQMSTAQLSLTSVSSVPVACEWVRQYYAYEGLSFNTTVKEGISRLLESSRFGWFFALTLNKEAIGYAVITRAFDHEIGGEFAILTDFFLLEQHRGQGNGSRALELIEEFARSQGFRSLDLYVLNHNAGVRPFYARRGFREVNDRRPMTKSLTAAG